MSRDEIFDEHGFHDLGVLRFENWLEVNRIQIAALFCEVAAFVENVGDTTTHAGGKISPTSSEHQDQAPRHVFATMVTNALDHSGSSGGANCEALASDSVEKRFAAGGAIEGNVADQNILLSGESGPSRRIYNP